MHISSGNLKYFKISKLQIAPMSTKYLSASRPCDTVNVFATISMTDRYSHLTLQHFLDKQVQLANHYSNFDNFDKVSVGIDIG